MKKVIPLSVIALLLIVIVPTVYATHLYSGAKFYTNNPKYCISTSYGSGTGSLKEAIKSGWADMNALPSSFTGTLIPYDSNCFNHMYPFKFNNPSLIAVANTYRSNPTTINHIDQAYNTDYTWTGSLSCSNPSNPSIGPYNIRATTRHELGHWIAMHHPSSTTEYTIMHFNADCYYWNSYKSHDISTIKAVWP